MFGHYFWGIVLENELVQKQNLGAIIRLSILWDQLFVDHFFGDQSIVAESNH